MNGLRGIFLLAVLLIAMSISQAIIIGVSPASQTVTLSPGQSKDISFGLSTNATTDVVFYCSSKSPYITCPDSITLVNGTMTFFNATIHIPKDVKFNSTVEVFELCLEKQANATVISCLGPKVAINIEQKGGLTGAYIALLFLIGVILIMLFIPNKKLIKHKKKHK